MKNLAGNLWQGFLLNLLLTFRVFLTILTSWCGHLAQSVEHLTFNQRVTGSSPVVPTIPIKEFEHFISKGETKKSPISHQED